MSISGCEHLDEFKEKEGLQPYQVLHAYFVVCSAPGSREYKVSNNFCHVCDKTLNRLHACLECVFFGCVDHIDLHYADTSHCFAVELTFGQVLCMECGDYVYDSEFEAVAKANELIALRRHNRPLSWVPWSPTQLEQQLLKYHAKRVCIKPDSTIGLRGLINLGHTCYMNCIVQALMHTSLLRDYFLAERHVCKKTSSSCLMCQFSWLYQEFYKGARTPLCLSQMLHLMWTNVPSIAGYKQHDVHEFFLATLDTLHKHCVEAVTSEMTTTAGKSSHCVETMTSEVITPASKSSHCTCIIDQTFTGELQSNIVCQNCNGVSPKIEPISVISLDVGCPSQAQSESRSLRDCLESLTRTEHLGDNVEIFCSSCKSKQKSTKQLTLKTLPVVVSFHLKRFANTNEKNSTFISFPEMFDMTPFMSQSTAGALNGDGNLFTDNRYSLFAVVKHDGPSVNFGHYIVYVRQQHNYWYKCNDDVITRVELSEVLESEGYLLFYQKHILEYE